MRDILQGMDTSNASASEMHLSRRKLRLRGGLVLAVCAGLGFAVWMWFRSGNLPHGISAEDYARGSRTYRTMYGRTPDRQDVLMLLGEVAVRDGRDEDAVRAFQAVLVDESPYRLPARIQEAQALMRLKRIAEAEGAFRTFLDQARGNPLCVRDHLIAAYKWLGYILSVQLRFEERHTLLAEMHASGLADVYDSKQFFFPHLLIWHSPLGRQPVTECLKLDPQNVHLRVALGRYRTFEGQLDEARTLLENLHRELPRDLGAVAALLECHFERSDWSEFAKLAKELPPDDPGDPWLLTQMRGQWALHEQRWNEAARHFESLRKADPANPVAMRGLARASGALQRTEARDEADRVSLVLSQIRSGLMTITEDDPQASALLASRCEQIGLREAAETFRQHASRIRRNLAAMAGPEATSP